MKIDLFQETSLLIHKNFLKTIPALGIRLFSNDFKIDLQKISIKGHPIENLIVAKPSDQ